VGELDAISSEGLTFAAGVLEIARRIEQAMVAGTPGLIAMYADRLERAATQQGARVKRAQVLARLRQAELEGTPAPTRSPRPATERRRDASLWRRDDGAMHGRARRRLPLVNVGVRALCGECLEVATDLGMAPQRIPSWLARGRRGENRAKETTGAPA
jgi:hypothetical protein